MSKKGLSAVGVLGAIILVLILVLVLVAILLPGAKKVPEAATCAGQGYSCVSSIADCQGIPITSLSCPEIDKGGKTVCCSAKP